jgi:hypothetical protein
VQAFFFAYPIAEKRRNHVSLSPEFVVFGMNVKAGLFPFPWNFAG